MAAAKRSANIPRLGSRRNTDHKQEGGSLADPKLGTEENKLKAGSGTFYVAPKSSPQKAVTSCSEGNRERILVLVLNLGKKSQIFHPGTWGPKKSLAPELQQETPISAQGSLPASHPATGLVSSLTIHNELLHSLTNHSFPTGILHSATYSFNHIPIYLYPHSFMH